MLAKYWSKRIYKTASPKAYNQNLEIYDNFEQDQSYVPEGENKVRQ